MKLPPAYELQAIIHRSASHLIARARERSSGAPVIVKTLEQGRGGTQALASIHHECSILNRLDIPGVAKVRNLLYAEGRPLLVMDDLGGVSLRAVMEAGPIDAAAFFTIARSLTATLEQLHRARVIHKNINPDHVIVNPETSAVQLVDFSIASVLPHETQSLASPRVLEGALPYISPEQTGRMNRSIDRRTDFYSLGVTLYELLAGRLPFAATSPLEWVHCHIAKPPLDLREASPECPLALARIVMKLFSKTAQGRYQSTHGLLRDLELCESAGRDAGPNAAFIAGRHDRTDQLQLPQKLYGRQVQIDTLLEAFDEVCAGATAMMVVAGHSGIGKTSLIAEIHKPIVRHRGYFISGKFDQFKGDIPYASLIQAFRELVRQLMSESEEALREWRRRLLAALGANAQIIIDVLPDVEGIIGPQAQVPSLDPLEAKNRFNRVFQDFVRVFASPEHPLALFLDDLQWADSASLELLCLLCTDTNSSHLFLVGAYRDNEVDAAHPLVHMLRGLDEAGAKLGSIDLEPLERADIEQLIADALLVSTEAAAELAHLVHERTLGNPFFVRQCLGELYDSKLVTFDANERVWTWELEAIRGVGLADNVVELMAGKISRLAPPTQEVLTLAACIGASFDIETLAVVANLAIPETVTLLWPALEHGLVLPVSDAARLLQRGEGEIFEAELHVSVSCRFLHDRVQQAAYSMITEANKHRVHLEIGRRLLAQTQPASEARRFDVVNHMNIGAELIEDPAQRLQLAELNAGVGVKAKDSTAYDSAAGYLRKGIELLPDAPWERAYPLAFELHKGLAECTYLLGDFESAEALFELLLTHAQSHHEQAEVYNIRIAFYSSVGRFTDAINAGFEGLELFGIEMRSASADLRGAIERELACVDAQLGGRSWSALVALPLMTDPAVQDCMQLLMNLTTQTYIADQDWFPLVAMKMVNLSLTHGNSTVSAFGYAYLGVVLGTLRGEYEAGRELGELSLELNELLLQTKLYGKLNWIIGGLINHWTRHLRTNIPLLRTSVHRGIESGDYVFGSWAYYYLVVSTLLCGERLDRTLAEADDAIAFFDKIKNKTYADLQELVRNVVLNLQGASSERSSLSTETFDEDACLEDMRARSHGPGLGRYHALKLMVLCIHEQHEGAVEMGRRSEQTLCYLTAQPLLAEHFFYYGISLCARVDEVDATLQPALRERATHCLERLREWAASCPENFLHKATLLEAELARLDGRLLEAQRGYEAAIEGASEHGFLQNEAMAHLLAGKLCLATGLATAAKAHLQGASDLYGRWGAKSRVQDLEAAYPCIQTQSRERLGDDEPSPSSAGLDAMTLIKTTRAMSSELQLGSLLETIVELMAESIGARVGYLFLERGGQLVEAARSGAVDPPDQGPPRYAQRVVNYVRRTGERVISSDARHDPTFGEDPHVSAQRVKSLLCMPMQHKGATVGLLYFENAALTGTFTPARVEILELQSAQATVSLENARLYAELGALNAALELRVEERTAQLSTTNAALELELELRAQRELERDRLQRRIIAMKEARVRELSTPLIPISDQIMVMPLIGSMDPERADRVMEVLLAGAAARAVKVVILDLTGLSTIDTATASTIASCARALRLLGTKAVLTGLRPDAARMLVQLGVEVEMETRRTLQSGIAYAMGERMGPGGASS